MLYLLSLNFLKGKWIKMESKLKTLSCLVYPEGPIFNKIQLSLEAWKVAYKKREKVQGDDAVIKFLDHFGELKNSSRDLDVTTKK